MMIDRLIDAIIEKDNPTALGLDTCLDFIPEDMRKGNMSFTRAAGIVTDYNIALIDTLHEIVPCVKVQSAYYEMYGLPGIGAFKKTLDYAKEKGLITIADVKRNDIGSTAEAYAKAYLGCPDEVDYDAALSADFITVNAYLGSDGIMPFVKKCGENEKGIFILVKTSNPSSGEFQDLLVDEVPMYEKMGFMVAEWGVETIGKYGFSSIGAVVGANYPEQGASLREKLPGVFFLIPGYGAQGAKGRDIAGCFDSGGLGGVVNASRSIICAYKNELYEGLEYTQAAKVAALTMKEDLLNSLNAAGKPILKMN